jgi:dienelactone hydrolase
MSKLILIFLLLTSLVQAEANLVTLDTRSGVTQQIIVEQSSNAQANLILFAGGKGKLKLNSNKYKTNKNFLVRSRHLFTDNNFTVILVDAPSDKQGKLGMLKGFRNSQKHVQDIEAVIDYVRSLNDKPIWLIGTSRGTESAAYAAVHLNNKIDGLVLTSSISKTNNKGTSVINLPLDKITVPVLAIHHTQDACKTTRPGVVKDIKRKAYNSSRVEVKLFTGGDKPISNNPCQARTYHGYLGIENKVVRFITSFINQDI